MAIVFDAVSKGRNNWEMVDFKSNYPDAILFIDNSFPYFVDNKPAAFFRGFIIFYPHFDIKSKRLSQVNDHFRSTSRAKNIQSCGTVR